MAVTERKSFNLPAAGHRCMEHETLKLVFQEEQHLAARVLSVSAEAAVCIAVLMQNTNHN